MGPEAPLAAGLSDSLSAAGIRCFGPKQAAAQIEASKVFAKDFMARHHIPTARYSAFSNFEKAIEYCSLNFPHLQKSQLRMGGFNAGERGIVLVRFLRKKAREFLDLVSEW